MERIRNAVEKYRQLMLDAERFIWKHPETGYREVVTSAYMEDAFRKLGYELTCAEGVTGFYTVIDTGRPGPEVMILAELDSIICPAHKDADPVTGAVHSCGHNVQCATMLGIAGALRDDAVLERLSGRIRLCVVPAEELLEIEYRMKLKEEGVIKYFGGKTEFLYRGYFEGVDIAFMVHASQAYRVIAGSVGCLAKNIVYKGKASHAGGSPWNGNNALYAATCGINAVNALRETFRESDIIRVHPIITHGGDMVNAIPETVRLESYVRGSSFDAIVETNKKVNRALTGAALSLGTNIEIIDMPGYAPLSNDEGLMKLSKEAADGIIPEQNCKLTGDVSSGSTDMGDLSVIMPAIHLYSGGTCGKSHGNDYQVVDPEAACVDSAKWQVAILQLLLGDGARKAKQIIRDFKPLFASGREYLEYLDSLNDAGDRIVYAEGKAEIRID